MIKFNVDNDDCKMQSVSFGDTIFNVNVDMESSGASAGEIFPPERIEVQKNIQEYKKTWEVSTGFKTPFVRADNLGNVYVRGSEKDYHVTEKKYSADGVLIDESDVDGMPITIKLAGDGNYYGAWASASGGMGGFKMLPNATDFTVGGKYEYVMGFWGLENGNYLALVSGNKLKLLNADMEEIAEIQAPPQTQLISHGVITLGNKLIIVYRKNNYYIDFDEGNDYKAKPLLNKRSIRGVFVQRDGNIAAACGGEILFYTPESFLSGGEPFLKETDWSGLAGGNAEIHSVCKIKDTIFYADLNGYFAKTPNEFTFEGVSVQSAFATDNAFVVALNDGLVQKFQPYDEEITGYKLLD